MLEFINVQNFMKKYHSDQKFLKKIPENPKFFDFNPFIPNGKYESHNFELIFESSEHVIYNPTKFTRIFMI